LLLFSVLYGFWVANYVAFKGDVVRELAAQFLALADKQAATVPLMIGHRLMGQSLLYTGDVAQGRAQYDQAIALYDPAEHRQLATRFGQDVRVAILCYRSFALWLLGYPEAARTEIDRGLKHAREIGHAATLMYAIAHAVLPYTFCGDHATAIALADEVVALENDTGASIWRAIGTMEQGLLFALTDKPTDAVRRIGSGLSEFRSTGSTVWTPLYLAHLALAHAKLSQSEDAWRCISEATTAMETSNERLWEPEVNRIAGEIALKSLAPDPENAEAHFENALAVARQQRAKSWELRAAMSLAGSGAIRIKVQQARDLLAPVYKWFTEGFDTRDLKDAKALLDALG
jgi:predicted ATPase